MVKHSGCFRDVKIKVDLKNPTKQTAKIGSTIIKLNGMRVSLPPNAAVGSPATNGFSEGAELTPSQSSACKYSNFSIMHLFLKQIMLEKKIT